MKSVYVKIQPYIYKFAKMENLSMEEMLVYAALYNLLPAYQPQLLLKKLTQQTGLSKEDFFKAIERLDYREIISIYRDNDCYQYYVSINRCNMKETPEEEIGYLRNLLRELENDNYELISAEEWEEDRL